MSPKQKRCLTLVILLYIVVTAALPPATAVFEFRQELRSGNLLYNNDVGGVLAIRVLNHQQTAVKTSSDSFAMSPTIAHGTGFGLAQTSADTVAASETGFDATARFSWIPYEVGHKIGDTPGWAANVQPISFEGLPPDSMMIFPSMTLIHRLPKGTANGSPYIVDTNASLPMYPGNQMVAKNVTDQYGRNTSVLEPIRRNSWTPDATDQEIADKTILQRMWANSHINLNLDRAYLGETCYPTLIYPVKASEFSTVMPLVPDKVSMGAAMNLTRPGMHLRKAFWPVG